MKPGAFGALLTTILVSLGLGNAQAVIDDFLVVPGERIGVVKLGITTLHTWPAVYDAHHIHPDWRKRGDIETMCWTQIGVCATFFLRRGGAVHTAIQVVTTNPQYRTRQGFHVGLTYTQAKRILGQPLDYEPYSSGAVAQWPGMEVEIVSSRIRSIAVGRN